MIRRLLPLFGAAQRPVAWALLALSPVVLIGVLANIVETGDAKIVTVVASLDLLSSALGTVMAAENEAQDGGQAR